LKEKYDFWWLVGQCNSSLACAR